jgi:dihydrofolate reductase
MGRLIYSMIQSLDGYTEDGQGDFSWGAPDAALHTFVNELASSVGTYLYGRRMYETMVYWETAHTLPDQPQHELDWARQWQAAEKIVYSRTLAEPRSARTRIEREFDPEAVRRLKASAAHDLTVDGPELAAQALRAGLVDEIQPMTLRVGAQRHRLPGGGRGREALFPRRRAAEPGAAGGAALQQRRRRPALRRPWLGGRAAGFASDSAASCNEKEQRNDSANEQRQSAGGVEAAGWRVADGAHLYGPAADRGRGPGHV